MDIYENSPGGTFVVKVNATDGDVGDYGEIRYRLVDNPNNAFDIDEMTVSCSPRLSVCSNYFVCVYCGLYEVVLDDTK